MHKYWSQWDKEELDSMDGIELDDLIDELDCDEEREVEDHPISLWSLGMSYKDFM